ncbi:MAG TPA: transglutaminase family protein [Yeosuana sp.]
MIYKLSHTTSYKYESNVTFCHNIAILKPKTMVGQSLLEYRLDINPLPTEISEKVDFFGNTITRFSIQKSHKELSVKATSKIVRNFSLQADIFNSVEGKSITLESALEALEIISSEILEVKQFLLDSILISKITDDIRAYAQISFKPYRSVFEASFELMQRIYTDFKFDSKFSNIATPLTEVMKAKKGVCQDFAQIAIACVRSIGLPARYVSGYIETMPPPGKEKLIGTDASHAWFSVYIPKFGWIDFDPTNNQIPKDQHITVSYGRDYYDVAPLKGVIYSNGRNSMKVSVDIRPDTES